MVFIDGILVSLLEWVVALLSRPLGVLWGWISALLGGLFGSVWAWGVALLSGLLGILWGWVLFLALFGMAVILNILGVDDVPAVLHRTLTSDDTDETAAVETALDVSATAVTDEQGRFSPEAFARVTGMNPAEFVHLFVKTSGGRVKQQTLTTCLPWSKSTVSRLLDTLERDGVIERVTMGRENIVCTPESVPDSQS